MRGGTYFSLPPQRKVGKRKRLEAPAKRAPWFAWGSGATGIRVLSHSALVTKDSSAPTPHCVRRGRVRMGNRGGGRSCTVGAIGFALARTGLPRKPRASFEVRGNRRLRLDEVLKNISVSGGATWRLERPTSRDSACRCEFALRMKRRRIAGMLVINGEPRCRARHAREPSRWFGELRVGARSAAGSMTALSLGLNVRGHRFQMHHCLLQARSYEQGASTN